MVSGRLHDDAEIEKAVADRRGFLGGRFERFAVADEFDAQVKPHAVNGADERKPVPERLEPALEMGADRAGIFLQGVVVKNVEDGQADDGTHGAAAGGREEIAFLLQRIGNLAPGDDRAQRMAVAHALGDGDDIGHDALLLETQK